MTTTFTSVLADEIRAETARRRLSGRKLADAIETAGGIGRASVARMLAGQRPWDVNSLSVVAEELHLSVSELVGRADATWRSMTPSPTPTGPGGASERPRQGSNLRPSD